MSRPYTVPKTVVAEVLGGEAVVLHLETGSYFSLNGTATRMWDLLKELDSEAAVVDRLLSEFSGVDQRSLEADLNSLIAELLARGLLERRSE